jgi:ATP-dependent Clp protease ATP-binding subunit ClpC
MILCDNCMSNPAAGQLVAVDRNGRPRRVHLCEECAVKVGPQMFGEEPAGLGDGKETGRYSEQAIDLIALARTLAGASGPSCDTEHLLAALVRTQAGTEAFQELGATDEQLRQVQELVDNMVGNASRGPKAIAFTSAMQSALEIARQRAIAEGSDVTPAHLLHGLLAEDSGTAGHLLRGAGLQPKPPKRTRRRRRHTPALDHFGRDLTEEARHGKLDKVIGRGKEIEQAIETLARRRKNNPVLIGDPGVGKTAIAEGIAQRIAAGEVPEELRDCRLVAVDVAGVVAGASVRGSFEERVKKIIEETVASEGEIILFVDELHNLLGTGRGSDGAMSAAEILKPALARGEVRLIGATTLDEYREIERDGALERRFTPIYVSEPSVEDTVAILRGLRGVYEQHHNVTIDDDALHAAVKLSDRYITDRFLPDKAIDLIDQAAARARLRATTPVGEIEALRTELADAEQDKTDAVAREDFERAAQAQRRINQLNDRISELTSRTSATKRLAVGVEDICEVLEAKTGVPATEMASDELERLRGLADALRERVIGQDHAVEAVADAVRRNRAGMHDGNGPICTFLFLGPTGVGKTELAKALAERVFGSRENLVRLDMSEFSERHTTARLFGSPPGYVGYGQGGQLTEPVRRRPYSVVLLDEIEKAHPAVHQALLQLLGEGRMTDGEGRTVDFRNTIVIMTSNLGAGEAKRSVGFAADTTQPSDGRAEAIREAVKRAFSPEFINRIDEQVIFNSLSEDDIAQITVKLCRQVADRARERHGIELTVGDEVIQQLAKDGFDQQFGARPLKRHIRRTLEKALVDALIDGKLRPGQAAAASLTQGQVTITARPREVAEPVVVAQAVKA